MFAQDRSVVGVQLRLVRRAPDGDLQVLIRVREPFGPVGEQTKHVVCAGIVGLALEDPVCCFGGPAASPA